jgi:hypothetical protein
VSDLRWSKGGEAVLLTLEDDAITLRSTIPSAPGSRLDGTLANGSSFRVKVHSCRKTDAEFVIAGRTIDMRREVRAEIVAMLAARA